MMKKVFFKILSVAVLFSASLEAIPSDPELVDGAAVGRSITKYNVTINKLEVFNSETGTYVTLSDTPTAVNIASGTAGADIAAMVANATIPYGTYTKTRATIANTFTINACYSATQCTGGTRPTIGDTFVNNAMAVATTAAAGRADTAVTIDFTNTTYVSAAILSANGATALTDGVQIIYDHPTPLIVNQNTTAFNVDVKFNLGGGVFRYNVATTSIYVDFPTVTISF